MLPDKFIPIHKSKLYKALKFYNTFEGFIINKNQIKSYEELEYLTILFTLDFIKDDHDEYFIKLYQSK